MQKQVVVIERDIDKDRFITYDEYKQILKQFAYLSKYQCYFYLLGQTGARPSELVKSKITDIDFEGSKLKRVIGKPMKFYNAGEGDTCAICQGDGFTPRYESCRRCKGTGVANVRAIKYKIKWTCLSTEAMNYLKEYVRHNFQTFTNGYLFPSRQSIHEYHMSVASIETTLQRLRDKLYYLNPIKWGWMKDSYQDVVYANGHTQHFYKVSLYAFRKMHATYYMYMLQDKYGVTDASFHASKHMGHSKPATTYTYLLSMLNEKDMANGMRPVLEKALEVMPRMDRRQKKLVNYC